MAERYFEHEPEKGDSWKDCDIDFLYNKLVEEYKEVLELVNARHDDGEPRHDEIKRELIDLGLVAAMCHARELYAKQGRAP